MEATAKSAINVAVRSPQAFGIGDESNGRTMGYVLVFLGGGLGAMLRHGVNLATARLIGTAFPWNTFFINVTGSLVMGLIAGWFALKADASQGCPAVSDHRHSWRLHHLFGLFAGCGACSTSAARSGQAAFYVIGSVVLSIGGLFAGLWLVRHFS